MPRTAKHSLPRRPLAAEDGPRGKLPGWARWLCGYAAVLAGCAGLVYCWRVLFFGQALGVPPAGGLTLAAMGIGTLLYAALYGLWRLSAHRLCLAAAGAVFAAGLLFCFATAPLQAPDETGYYLRANSISRGGFVYQYEEDYPEDVDLLVEKFFPTGAQPLNFRVTYQGARLAGAALEDYLAAAANGEKAETPAPEALVFLDLPFLHQGLFMAAARLFGAGALGQLYAARIANLLLYSLICYFAFVNARRFRGLFFAFALLPVSLFMAASCSYDGLSLALCYYALSFACRDEIDFRSLCWFAAALLLANYIKPLNFLLAAVLLLVPAARWKLQKPKLGKLKPWMLGLLCAALAVGFWFVMDRVDRQISYAGGWPRPEDLPRGSGDSPDQLGQLGFMLQNPLRFIATALLSAYEADGFLFDLGRLGHMDLVVPLAGGLSLLCLCAATALAAPKSAGFGRRAPLGMASLAALYGAAVLGIMYIADTDLGSIRITGQQPRYFLPAMLLVFLALALLLGRVRKPSLAAGGGLVRSEAFTLWLCLGVAVLVALLLFQSYYIGQWIPRSEGGWKLVNFYGWEIA